jgi:hypothetical protein
MVFNRTSFVNAGITGYATGNHDDIRIIRLQVNHGNGERVGTMRDTGQKL